MTQSASHPTQTELIYLDEHRTPSKQAWVGHISVELSANSPQEAWANLAEAAKFIPQDFVPTLRTPSLCANHRPPDPRFELIEAIFLQSLLNNVIPDGFTIRSMHIPPTLWKRLSSMVLSQKETISVFRVRSGDYLVRHLTKEEKNPRDASHHNKKETQ